jgi:hypothetical protein
MLKTLKTNIFYLFFFSTSFSFVAQNTILSLGGEVVGSGGVISHSIGQIFIENYVNQSGNVHLGIQQSYEITTLGLVSSEINVRLSIFPNPVSDYLIIEIPHLEILGLTYSIYDSQGKIIIMGTIQTDITQVSLSDLHPATYVLCIKNKELNVLQSFRLIKNL